MSFRVLVSVGTHEQPFQRLIDAAEMASRSLDSVEWTIQFGVANPPQQWNASVVRAERYFPSDEFDAHLQDADVLISQASPGNIMTALSNNAWPIVAGRSREQHEHVDNHQIEFAYFASRLGLATELVNPRDLEDALRVEIEASRSDRLQRCELAVAESERHKARFKASFWELARENYE